ncbi:hypothetical protein Tco_0898244 [Tanacetum coccineum]
MMLETFRELFELRLQELLQMFNATTAVRKATMLVTVQSQESGIQSTSWNRYSDYGGASLDRKSTIGGCQFLGRRLISWQCKKQTIVANSTTEAEYVIAANCCGQVLYIQNQMMDYGFNFMNTKIHIDNESTISVIKNLVAHSRTKHIEIRFHFIRDCYEKRLIKIIESIATIEGSYLGSRESLERDMDGAIEFLLSNLFYFWFTKVSTDMLKVSTDKKSLYRYKARENTGLVTPFHLILWLVQQTEDDGEASERPSDSQPIPSPPHPSEDQPQTQTDLSPRPSPSIVIPDSNPEGFGGNHGSQSSSDRSLSGNEDGLTLQSVYDLYISLCTQVSAQVQSTIKALKAQTKIGKEDFSEEKRGYKRNPSFDDLDDDAMDYMETEDAQDEGRTSLWYLGKRRKMISLKLIKKFKMLVKDEVVAERFTGRNGKAVKREKERFKRKKERSLPLNKEQNFFMIPLLHEGDFLLYKGLKLSEEINTYKNSRLKMKRNQINFVAIRSAEDERQIKEMNEESKDPEKKRLKKRVVNEEALKGFISFIDLVMKQYSENQPPEEEDIELIPLGRLVDYDGNPQHKNMINGDFWNILTRMGRSVIWRMLKLVELHTRSLRMGKSSTCSVERRMYLALEIVCNKCLF